MGVKLSYLPHCNLFHGPVPAISPLYVKIQQPENPRECLWYTIFMQIEISTRPNINVASIHKKEYILHDTPRVIIKAIFDIKEKNIFTFASFFLLPITIFTFRIKGRGLYAIILSWSPSWSSYVQIDKLHVTLYYLQLIYMFLQHAVING